MEPEVEDRTINCVVCGNNFVFTASQQEKFERMGFDAPKRCPVCRKEKAKSLPINIDETLERELPAPSQGHYGKPRGTENKEWKKPRRRDGGRGFRSL